MLGSSFFSLVESPSPDRRRLHSLAYVFYTRLLAVLLLVETCELGQHDFRDAVQQGTGRAFAVGVLHAVLTLTMALLFWLRPKPVIATTRGLELGSGKRLRVIPWQSVIDVQEVPWIQFSRRLYPWMFQVELTGGEAFDFAGVENARSIVIDFAKRSELGARATHGDSAAAVPARR